MTWGRAYNTFNADHLFLFLVICLFVCVNPLAATPLFSPVLAPQHGPTLSGLMVYMPWGRAVVPAPDFAERPCQAMHHRDFPLVDTVTDSRGCAFHLLPSPCQPGLVSNGKSHFGHGSLRRGAQSSRVQPTGCMAWQPTG